MPSAICRYISSRVAARTQKPTTDEVVQALEEFAKSVHPDVFDAMATEILGGNRALGPSGANKAARRLLDQRWATFQGRMGAISGKAAISHLSRWSQEAFGVSIAPASLAESLLAGEIPDEMAHVLRVVHNGRVF